jgi:hypothetical protein
MVAHVAEEWELARHAVRRQPASPGGDVVGSPTRWCSRDDEHGRQAARLGLGVRLPPLKARS